MSDETLLLEEIFYPKRWKNKYKVSWCEHCETAVIVCPECKNTTCNGGGCKSCDLDFDEFIQKTFHRVENYLTADEIKTYRKVKKLQDLIVRSIKNGEEKINWEALDKSGELSENDHEMFSEEIKKSCSNKNM